MGTDRARGGLRHSRLHALLPWAACTSSAPVSPEGTHVAPLQVPPEQAVPHALLSQVSVAVLQVWHSLQPVQVCAAGSGANRAPA